MLIIFHASKDNSNDQRVLREFRKLSDDRLLREKDVLLVTVEANKNRMLAARVGVSSSELPTLILLYSDRIFQYQGDLTSASLMRSYALQGYLNQGAGEPISNASFWLWIRTLYLGWLFNDAGNETNINPVALLFSGFLVGLLFFALTAVVVWFVFKGEINATTTNEKKRQ